MGQEMWQLRQELIRQFLKGKLRALDAAQRLGCSLRTLWRYRERFLKQGPEALQDHRHSNCHRLTVHDEVRIVQTKKHGLHRSTRWVRDHLRLRVHEKTVWHIFVKHQLNRITLPPIKPITRFQKPNGLQLKPLAKSLSLSQPPSGNVVPFQGVRQTIPAASASNIKILICG